MKLKIHKFPREFNCGDIRIKDFGKVFLLDDEMISMVTKSGKECDFTAKNWGFYPASSLNARLKREGFKSALVRYPGDKIFLNIIEEDKMDQFKQYLKAHDGRPKILLWLDELDGTGLDILENTLNNQNKKGGRK